MIVYAKHGLWCRVIGSALPRAVPQSAISPLIAFLVLRLYADYERAPDAPLYPFILHPYVHQIGMVGATFLLAFRVQIAHSRYWETATGVLSMRSKWLDAVIQIFALADAHHHHQDSSTSDHSEMLHSSFRATIGHLFSLLHAVAVIELKRRPISSLVDETLAIAPTLCGTFVKLFPFAKGLLPKAYRLHVLQTRVEVLGGLDLLEVQQLSSITSTSRTEFCMYRILLIVSNYALTHKLPDSIVSRIYAEISAGSLQSISARRTTIVPFSYPFFELMRWIKYSIILLKPFAILSFCSSAEVAYVACFVTSVIFVSMTEVAEELDNPCGADANDLNLTEWQKDFNETLYNMILLRALPIDEPDTPLWHDFQKSLNMQMRRKFESNSGGMVAAKSFRNFNFAQIA